MNTTTYIYLAAGLPPLAVIYYAVRLNRRFGTARAGWLLAASFTVLAPLYLLFFSGQLQAFWGAAIRMDIAYSVTCLLLLILLRFTESLLKEREQTARLKLQSEAELESRLAGQTAELAQAREKLVKTHEELQQATARLEAEIEEGKRTREQLEKTQAQLLAITRQADLSRVAAGVLQNAGKSLNSINVSATLLADGLRRSKVQYVSGIAQRLHQLAVNPR
ncbi:MAG: hypothetical protein KGJ60_14020 [Verrucomicrobiota bacterium]|nr:hypothetical protein [Verrucomicrobiota bacterium]